MLLQTAEAEVKNQPLQGAQPAAPTADPQLSRNRPANIHEEATNQIKAHRTGKLGSRGWEGWKKRSICCARCSTIRPPRNPWSCCNNY